MRAQASISGHCEKCRKTHGEVRGPWPSEGARRIRSRRPAHNAPFFIRICRKRVCDRQRGIYQQHEMQKIQMALMLAAQQLQQNRAQRFRSELFMQKARKPACKQPPRQAAQAGYAECSVSRCAGRTGRRFYPETERRCTSETAEPRLLQGCSRTGLPATQRSRSACRAGPRWIHGSSPRDDRKRFRVINGGDPAAGHRLRRFLKEPHTILPSTGSGR